VVLFDGGVVVTGVIAKITENGKVKVTYRLKGRNKSVAGRLKGLIRCPECKTVYARTWETLFDVWPIDVEGRCYSCKKKASVS